MTYDLTHWDNPRAAIATKYVNNDFAYVSRGANIAFYILKEFNISPNEAKDLTVLDYGCGTGRAAAFLALIFKTSVGYDPNINCIKVAKEENLKSELNVHNLILTDNVANIPQCDIAFSTNVIEHLDYAAQQIMIDTLKSKVTGKSLLWYNPAMNNKLEPYIVSSVWADKLRGGKIQIDFFDIH
jgi:2-polyprenyl-3-methyl-5-hydroxy-6-metoxy-1,4-benzoquinol methylase